MVRLAKYTLLRYRYTPCKASCSWQSTLLLSLSQIALKKVFILFRGNREVRGCFAIPGVPKHWSFVFVFYAMLTNPTCPGSQKKDLAIIGWAKPNLPTPRFSVSFNLETERFFSPLIIRGLSFHLRKLVEHIPSLDKEAKKPTPNPKTELLLCRNWAFFSRHLRSPEIFLFLRGGRESTASSCSYLEKNSTTAFKKNSCARHVVSKAECCWVSTRVAVAEKITVWMMGFGWGKSISACKNRKCDKSRIFVWRAFFRNGAKKAKDY